MKIISLFAGLFLVAHSAVAAQGPDSPNSVDNQLVQQSFDGQLAKVQTLVEKGAAVDSRGGKSRTALMWAAANGHADIVEYLHSKGADINARDGDNQTALMLAVRRSYVPIVEYLLKNGAEVNVQSLKRQTSALTIAAAVGDETVVRMLLDSGADKSLVELGGHTALDRARQFGHPSIVALLEDPPAAAPGS